MGGNAFTALLPHATFPRMHPNVYHSLKTKLTTALKSLYADVATPHEAPEKHDHGDVDFIVFGPRPGISHEDVKSALGARWSISATGNGKTSNFAIPVDAIEPLEVGGATTTEVYYQVDVHVCSDPEDWKRVVFFHSYGDLGMILGLMARNVGLSVGSNGLKLAHPIPTSPPITFHLTSDFPRIFDFLCLSMDRWERGFATQREVFDWVATSPYFDARRMPRSDSEQTARKKAREVRGMYQNFLEYARQLSVSSPLPSELAKPQKTQASDAAIRAALQFFDKEELYDILVYVAGVKQHVKQIFTGKLVTEWTGIKGVPVRWVMDEVKARLGGDIEDEVVGSLAAVKLEKVVSDANATEAEGGVSPVHLSLTRWERVMDGMTLDRTRELVIQVRDEMNGQGKLEFDWREAKRRKAEEKLQAASENGQLLTVCGSGHIVATPASIGT